MNIIELQQEREHLIKGKAAFQDDYDAGLDRFEQAIKAVTDLLKFYVKPPKLASPQLEATTDIDVPKRAATAPAPVSPTSAPTDPTVKPPRRYGPVKGYKLIRAQKEMEAKALAEAEIAAKEKAKEAKSAPPPLVVAADPTPHESDSEFEDEDSGDDEDEEPEAAPAPPSNSNLPPGVTLGRNGRPRLLESIVYLLKTHGSLHLTDIEKKLKEAKLEPHSQDMHSYISYTLSRNPKVFQRLGKGQRGFWRLAAKHQNAIKGSKEGYSSKEGPVTVTIRPIGPKVTIQPNRTTLSVDSESEQPSELKEIQQFRAKEGSVSVDHDEAASLVEELTNPSRLNGVTSTGWPG